MDILGAGASFHLPQGLRHLRVSLEGRSPSTDGSSGRVSRAGAVGTHPSGDCVRASPTALCLMTKRWCQSDRTAGEGHRPGSHRPANPALPLSSHVTGGW